MTAEAAALAAVGVGCYAVMIAGWGLFFAGRGCFLTLEGRPRE